MKINLIDYVNNTRQRRVLVFGTNIGASIIHEPLSVVYTDVEAQVEAINAFDDCFNGDFLTTAMDLSVEAECFGSQVKFLDNSTPVVIERFITDIDQIKNVHVPEVGEGRTKVCMDIVQKLISGKKDKPILGGVIGPFTLASRLFGITEIFELVLLNPESAIELIEKCNQFLINYTSAIKSLGADGVVLAEPLAGLLSPKNLNEFSSKYIKEIVEKVKSPYFKIIYHNCAAKVVHLKQIYESAVSFLHFGEPMDIPAALSMSPQDCIVSGNLDPVKVFLMGDVDFIEKQTSDLLQKAKNYPNFLISPGCDLPADISKEKIDAFYMTARSLLSANFD